MRPRFREEYKEGGHDRRSSRNESPMLIVRSQGCIGEKNMVWLGSTKPKAQSLSMIERILSTGRLSRQEHFHLVSTILSDQQLEPTERLQINRILDGIKRGTFHINHE